MTLISMWELYVCTFSQNDWFIYFFFFSVLLSTPLVPPLVSLLGLGLGN